MRPVLGRPLGRLAVIAGVLLVGWVVLRGGTKDVVLVYGLGSARDATALDVDLRRGGASVRRAEFRFAQRAPDQVRHAAKLPEGDYTVAFTIRRPGGDVRGERALSVTEDGTVVLSLGP